MFRNLFSETAHCNWRWLFSFFGIIVILVYFVASKVLIGANEKTRANLSASRTPEDVVGNLGGMRVRIPGYYVKNVEYDDDPFFGDARTAQEPERTCHSKLRSFRLDARFPDMAGVENEMLRLSYDQNRLKADNPWISVLVKSGRIYPSLGERATDGLASGLWKKSEFWFANFERAPARDVANLEAYVVTESGAQEGRSAEARESVKDIYIHRASDVHVDTYISCGRTFAKGGVAACEMDFGFEPDAKVQFSVSFYPNMLQKWNSIRLSVRDLFRNFENKSHECEVDPV